MQTDPSSGTSSPIHNLVNTSLRFPSREYVRLLRPSQRPGIAAVGEVRTLFDWSLLWGA